MSKETKEKVVKELHGIPFYDKVQNIGIRILPVEVKLETSFIFGV